jgi:hypothetical protein
MMSMRMSLPLAGGVALVEMPVEMTRGMPAMEERICSKYSERSFQVLYVFSWMGMGSDMVCLGS